jgi:serine palmitoyltransferase
MRDLTKEIPLFVAYSTHLSWALLFLIGHIRDALAQLFFGGTHKENRIEKGYAALRQDYEDFYTRRAYYRVIGCFNRPVTSAPTRVIDIVMRTGKPAMPEQTPTGEQRKAINLGSYNYLGFASLVWLLTGRFTKVRIP